MELTERQIKILKAIIEEYIQSGEPTGSETLEKKHDIGASPATIRNEMVKLTHEGYLSQPHTSAGRVPTPEAFRFYIKELMKEKELSVADEVAVKEKIWDYRLEPLKFLQETARVLAEKTKKLAVVTTERGEVFSSGFANILDIPEFYDIDVTKTVLSLIEEAEALKSLFAKALTGEEISVLLGEELGSEYLTPCGLVFTHFKAGPKFSGNLGVIGPFRLDYSFIIPIVRYFGNLIEEIAQGW